MKKLFGLVVLLSVVSLAAGACTGTRHSSKDREQWGEDHAACERSVRKELSENPGDYGADDEIRLIKICMDKKKGWRK